MVIICIKLLISRISYQEMPFWYVEMRFIAHVFALCVGEDCNLQSCMVFNLCVAEWTFVTIIIHDGQNGHHVKKQQKRDTP